MSAIGGVSGMGSAMKPQVVSGASMRMPPAQKMANLFSKIDTSGSGSISKAQFEQAFQKLNPPPAIKTMGADAVFNKLDTNGTGSVSKQDFINGLKSMAAPGFKHHLDTANTTQNNASQTLTTSINSLKALGNQPTPASSGAVGNTINILA